jgi:hypothetical protein
VSAVYRYLLYLVLLLAAAFAIYAAVADLPPPLRPISTGAPPPGL